MELSKAKDIHVGGQAAKELWLDGRMVWAAMPEAIRQSMVLWYDLRRQGATNQSMAADPRLLDLSGNGHHATCQGFAWKGMSGVGGYYFQSLHSNAQANKYVVEYNSDCSVVTFKERKAYNESWMASLIKSINIGDNVHYKIEVSGLSKLRQSFPDTYLTDGGDGNQTKYYEDGVYENQYTATNIYATMSLYNVFKDAPADLSLDVTIRQIPLYPHALVADGVDDKAVMYSGFPMLADYTVIAKRDPQYNMMISNRKTGATDKDGAFQIERPWGNQELGTNTACWSFGHLNDLVRSTDSIIWQTRENYCGTPITAGTAEAHDTLTLFTFAPYADSTYKSIFYSLLLFDRSLSDEEIAWVRANLMDGGE